MYMDASFAVHPDFKSHIGASMFLGKNVGGIQNFQESRNLTQSDKVILGRARLSCGSQCHLSRQQERNLIRDQWKSKCRKTITN